MILAHSKSTTSFYRINGSFEEKIMCYNVRIKELNIEKTRGRFGFDRVIVCNKLRA